MIIPPPATERAIHFHATGVITICADLHPVHIRTRHIRLPKDILPPALERAVCFQATGKSTTHSDLHPVCIRTRHICLPKYIVSPALERTIRFQTTGIHSSCADLHPVRIRTRHIRLSIEIPPPALERAIRFQTTGMIPSRADRWARVNGLEAEPRNAGRIIRIAAIRCRDRMRANAQSRYRRDRFAARQGDGRTERCAIRVELYRTRWRAIGRGHRRREGHRLPISRGIR